MTAGIFSFREAGPKELEAVSRQVAVAYRAAYRGMMREDYLSSLADNHWTPILSGALEAGNTCLIALHGDEIVGSIVFGVSTADPRSEVSEIFALYLLPDYIGLGIGQKLFHMAETLMTGRGAAVCLAEVLGENTRSIGFCLSQGFQITGDFSVEENGMLLHCKTLRKEWQKGSLS